MKLPMASTIDAPSYSRLATLHSCRRKYYYRYVLGLRSSTDSTQPLAGKAGHAALDVLYRQGYGAMDAAKAAVVAIMAEHEPRDDKLRYLNAEHINGILEQYVERYAEDDPEFRPLRLRPSDLGDALIAFEGEVDSEGYMMFAEAPMKVRLRDGSTHTVVIDLVGETPNGIAVMDHKWTTGYLGGGFTNKFLINHQPRLYMLAVEALLGECSGGAIINGLHMGEQANNPKSQCMRFDRYPFDYTDGQLQEALSWARVTQKTAQVEESEYGDDEQLWPQNPDSYHAGCDYLALCEVSPQMRLARIGQYDSEEKAA